MNELLFPLHGKECLPSGPGFTADELPHAEREGEEEERSFQTRLWWFPAARTLIEPPA